MSASSSEDTAIATWARSSVFMFGAKARDDTRQTYLREVRPKEKAMAADGKVLEITDTNFGEEVRDRDELSMVDFWAAWCGPCRLIAPLIEQLAEDYADRGLRVGKLDVDSNPQTASQFGVRSIPTVLFFRNGVVVDKVVGAVPRPHLEEKIKQHLAA